MSGLLKKIGVNVEVTQTTPRADAESLFRGFTDDERTELVHKVGQFYDMFLERVATGRHMSKEDVDAVGQGRVWMGQQAHGHKLVDKLGGMRHALEEARRLSGLSEDASIVEFPEKTQSLLDKALSLAGVRAAVPFTSLPVQMRSALKASSPLFFYGQDAFFARMDWVDPEAQDGSDDEASF
jgi:protease IV